MNFLIFLTILFSALFYTVTCSAIKRHIQTRISHGRTADRKDFPFIARLRVSNDHKTFGCVGTLISNRHILTAAHCLYDCGTKECLKKIEVYLGDVHRTKPDAHQKMYEVPRNNAIVHQNYNINHANSAEDIAIIPLPEDVEFNDYIKAVRLPRLRHSTLKGKTVITAGWGITQHRKLSDILLTTNLKIVDNEECNEFSFNGAEENMHICVKGTKTRTCGGDSGAPYIVKDKNMSKRDTVPWTIVGFNTDGYGDCTEFNPEVGMNVKYYLNWISSKTGIRLIK